MKLVQLFSSYPQYLMGVNPAVEVRDLTLDSRKAQEGSVFFAVRGTQVDGHRFVPEVCARQVAAVVVEDRTVVPDSFRGAVLIVSSVRDALDQIAAKFYGEPAESLFCVGVTGTNGKTSVTYMTEAVLSSFGWPTGVMGTINHHMQKHVWESQLTTPDALTLERRLAEFKALGARAAVFEVSSHALDQRRVENIPFDVAVFTNLTRDHLDYHGTMENYFSAKARLFGELLGKSTKPATYAVVNADDPWSKRIAMADRARVWTYGTSEADFRFSIISQDFSGTRFLLDCPRGKAEVLLPIPGVHNVSNAVAAIAIGLAAGASLETAAHSLETFLGVPGRLSRVSPKSPIHVFVDYAHTDDALRTVLKSLHQVRVSGGLLDAKIITVFGCGGDRDRGKRPLMAQAAAEASDLVWVTSDNPRSEDPMMIIKDCLKGIPSDILDRRVFVEVDRARAIEQAISRASTGDVVLIAGKGHEAYQIIGSERRPFDDAQVARECLK